MSPIPVDFSPGEEIGRSGKIDPTTTRHIKWIAKLGSQAFGNPVISQGKLLLGTNNESPRDAKYKGDRSVFYCLDEKTGELIWQFTRGGTFDFACLEPGHFEVGMVGRILVGHERE